MKKAASKSESVRITVRKVPDVVAAAKYAGLPPGVRPFVEGDRNGERYYQEFSNGTHTTLVHGRIGFFDILSPAIEFRSKFSDATAEEVHQRFPLLEAVLKLSAKDVERRIIPGADADEIADEFMREYEAHRPEVRPWSVFRSSSAEKGELAARFYEQLGHINKACRATRRKCLPVDILRQRFTFSELWREIDGLPHDRLSEWNENFNRRGRWDAQGMYECVAVLMRDGPKLSWQTVREWAKDYRKWRRESVSGD